MKNGIGLLAFPLSVLAITRFAVGGEGKTYSIPFHSANGMILLDAMVNGKPAEIQMPHRN